MSCDIQLSDTVTSVIECRAIQPSCLQYGIAHLQNLRLHE